MYPTDRSYTKDHEWVLVEGDTGTIGITDFAQGELGDIVYVELPETGAELQKGDVLGTIESVKAVSEIYAPFRGSVAEVNDALNEQPEMLNSDPHAGGWYCKMRIADTSKLEELLDAAAYDELTR